MATDDTDRSSTHDAHREHELVAQRAAELLPEEQAVGSDDPQAQAEAILEESAERTEVPDAAPDTHLERREAPGV